MDSTAVRSKGLLQIPSLLQRRPHDESVRVGKAGQVVDRDARTNQHRKAYGSRGVAHVIGRGLFTAGRTGHDHAVREKELGGPGGFDQRNIAGNGVRAVLLLDVGKHQHAIGADRAAVAQQLPRARFDDTLVRHVRKDETLHAHELRAASEGDGQCLAIRGGQHLNAEHQASLAFDFARQRGHGGGDLRTDPALQIWTVVHVLEGERGEPRVTIDPCFGDRMFDQPVDGMTRRRRSWKSADMQHPDECPRRAEALTKG